MSRNNFGSCAAPVSPGLSSCHDRHCNLGLMRCGAHNNAVKMGGESVGIMANILNGTFWPCVPAHGLPVVDVADVVAAHSLAAVSPKARGRCACCCDICRLATTFSTTRPAEPGSDHAT